MKKKCKCCKKEIRIKPILKYHNIPKKVQDFVPIGSEILDTGIDLDIYQCPFCSLIQIFQEPVDYYRDVIRAVAISKDMEKFRRKYFEEFVSYFDLKGKRIIEIGAGSGEYMKMMKKETRNISGIEHLHESVLKANKEGLSVYEMYLENESVKIPKGPYDAFYIMNYLEHVPHLSVFLQAIYNNITDDGCGLIEVPNGDYIINNNIFSEFMLEHLYYFTQSTLKNVLEINGFEVLSCESIWHDYIISARVKKKKLIDLCGFEKNKDYLIDKLTSIILKYRENDKRIAVWGAGHQSLTMLALANIRDEIMCVIDSAPFKQNRLTPVTHIPIYGPEILDKEKIDVVLVMAGSYTSEIIKKLNREYKCIDSISIM